MAFDASTAYLRSNQQIKLTYFSLCFCLVLGTVYLAGGGCDCDWVFAGEGQAAERDHQRRGHEGRLQNVRSECPDTCCPHILTLYWLIMPQLELTKTQIKKISNEDGFIAKADFIKCAQVPPLASIRPVRLRPPPLWCAGYEAAGLHRAQGGPQPSHGQHEGVQEGAGPQHQGEAPDCDPAGTLARWHADTPPAQI